LQLQNKGHEIFPVNSMNGDITKQETWDSFPQADIVVHLAARTFVPESWTQPLSFLSTNFNGTACALEYCKKSKAKLIFISSYLYGNPESLPISEEAKLYANNPYSLSKKMAEELCKFYSDNLGVKVIILRPFNVYGPGQGDNFLIPQIIKQIYLYNKIEVKDLMPKRDYVYVEDFVVAIERCFYLDDYFNIINIGTGKSYSVEEVISLTQKIIKSNCEVESLGVRRSGEVMDTIADISKAEKILNWKPTWNLSDGITEIVKKTVG
jgi:GDP-4-dehydro-6-deoxy-D-mannose reductase